MAQINDIVLLMGTVALRAQHTATKENTKKAFTKNVANISSLSHSSALLGYKVRQSVGYVWLWEVLQSA